MTYLERMPEGSRGRSDRETLENLLIGTEDVAPGTNPLVDRAREELRKLDDPYRTVDAVRDGDGLGIGDVGQPDNDTAWGEGTNPVTGEREPLD